MKEITIEKLKSMFPDLNHQLVEEYLKEHNIQTVHVDAECHVNTECYLKNFDTFNRIYEQYTTSHS